jgi:predicted nucleotidyltransferase component of viral defense system
MLSLLKNQIQKYSTDEEKFNYLRELIQIQTLKIIDQQGFSKDIAFVGGTALRILYDLNRFSEDLDFSLINTENFDFENMLDQLCKRFLLLNINLKINSKTKNNVYIAQLKFEKLLYELGLSSLAEQKLYIKLELDINPPEGADLEYTMQEGFFGIRHYDLSSLYAGKLHAILHRRYTKGRDYYDLMWYLTKKVKPNLLLLNNAITQSTGKKSKLDMASLKTSLIKRLQETNFKEVHSDLETFVQDSLELRALNQDNFLTLLC